MSGVQFTLIDYFFFAIVFVVSIAIGLYYGYKTKHISIEEYLLGGRKLHILPVTFSLSATVITGSSTIGQSMEVYAYGLHNWMFLIIYLLWVTTMQFVFLPVFYELQLLSNFTYLEMRFDRSVKFLASALYVISGLMIITVTIYVPALAFQQVTGINLYLIALVFTLLCTWYTAIGGIKAVVWTDVFQYVLILGSGIVILSVGLTSVGGIENVWKALDRGGRLTFIKTSLDLEERGSFWSYISIFFMLLYQFGVNQSSVQRFISLSSIRKVKMALWGQCILCELVILMYLIIGGIIYTTYETCDPLMTSDVKKIDQIFPYYVQESASLFTGFNGIFIAGIFAAGLSTTSTLLNTISGTIYNDFLGSRLKGSLQFHMIMKMIVAIVGASCILLVFLIERMGTIFAITVQCFTMSAVGVLGLFINGMMFPRINSKGAKCGVVVSMLALVILIVGGLNKKPDPLLPLRTDGCDFNTTINMFDNISPVNSNDVNPNEDMPWVFRMNFQYHCVIGLFINISTSYIVSLLTGGNTVTDQRLLVTFLRRNAPQETLMHNY